MTIAIPKKVFISSISINYQSFLFKFNEKSLPLLLLDVVVDEGIDTLRLCKTDQDGQATGDNIMIVSASAPLGKPEFFFDEKDHKGNPTMIVVKYPYILEGEEKHMVFNLCFKEAQNGDYFEATVTEDNEIIDGVTFEAIKN